MWFGKLTFDPLSGSILDETLRLVERELFEADWAQAKADLGRDPLLIELPRTPAQRRADALVELAIRARTAPTDGRRPAPLFTIVVGLETFTGPVLELFNRTVIGPHAAARWLTRADFERIVFESPSRVIDVSAQRRFFRGALRRAIQVRDRTCFHPLCDEPPAGQGHIDHIHPAAHGGPTTQNKAAGAATSTTSTATTTPPTPAPPTSATPTPAPTHPTSSRSRGVMAERTDHGTQRVLRS